MKSFLLFLSLLLFTARLSSQALPTRISIKQFGAKGDGKTNDQSAFEKASKYINSQKQNITLFIPYGRYIIGKQTEGTEWFLDGSNGLQIENCKNVTIEGEIRKGKYPTLKYKNGLYFGSFYTEGTQKYQPKMKPAAPYYNKKTCASIGSCIFITNSENVKIANLEIDGNQDGMIIGGPYGDLGYQLGHRGIYTISSNNTQITNLNIHHLGLDGIGVAGSTHTSITNVESTYNGRQGLSWTDGNYLIAKNCKFSYTGFARIASSPCAGVDIETDKEAKFGQFENCEFKNNKGCGLLADSGPSRDMTFTNCTFWGIQNWSAWIQKPNYVFNQCNFYGSFVNGFITTLKQDATKFYQCNFEDKPLDGKKAYGTYLLEIDGRKVMIFEACTFTANEKKVIWYNGASTQSNDEKADFKDCTINIKSSNLPKGSFWGVLRKMKIKNLKINYYTAKDSKYYLEADNNTVDGIEMKYLIK